MRRGGLLLRIRDTHLVGVVADLVEVPVDDLAGRSGQRTRPVAERLGDDGECGGRNGSGMRQPSMATSALPEA